MSRLDAITDWPERAARAKFRISALAVDCGVSERQLRRFIESKFRSPPHAWVLEQRLEKGRELLQQNLRLKEISQRLRFKSQAHFSREFKKHFGRSPRFYLKEGTLRPPEDQRR